MHNVHLAALLRNFNELIRTRLVLPFDKLALASTLSRLFEVVGINNTDQVFIPVYVKWSGEIGTFLEVWALASCHGTSLDKSHLARISIRSHDHGLLQD